MQEDLAGEEKKCTQTLFLHEILFSREGILGFLLEQLPSLEYLGLERCHLSREEGHSLGRALKVRAVTFLKSRISNYLKARAKRGSGVMVGTRGGTGEGVARIVRGLESSKHVIATLDEETRLLTVQRI